MDKNKTNIIMDQFGEKLIKSSYNIPCLLMKGIINRTSNNKILLNRYKKLGTLTKEQQECTYDMISEAISVSIYHFLEMFEEQEHFMKLIIIDDEKEYNILELSEKMGDEIARIDGKSWIDRFSQHEIF